MLRMHAPRTIDAVATGHCVNSVAIWSARARCTSRGASAVRDGIRVPQVPQVRLGGALTSADGGGIEAHAAARELDYYLGPIVNLERSQYGADVNLDRPFGET